jgi:aminomuconate-semialdehyde/2-hydroxymuconate-6-semialdehyde dehydrogenase
MLLRNFVAGEFVETGETFPDLDPATGREVAQVCFADARLVDRAVTAAREALAGAWGASTPAERADLLEAAAAEIDRRFDDFVAAEIADTGKPVEQARTLDIPRGAANFRFYANQVRHATDDAYHSAGVLSYTVHKPLGVVAVVVPWNLPFLLTTWKVAPALATGNAVVVKPSEETPYTATLLAEVMRDVGLPSGVFNVVHGFGPDSAGQWLISHPDIDGITFTGETATGSTIMRAAAGRAGGEGGRGSSGVRPVSFELGGKNPALVFADADFDAAVAGVVRSSFSNGGQVCLCTERVYVERPVFADFVAAVAARAEDVPLMPLISEAHREKVLGYYRLAEREGATVHCGGGVPSFGADDERRGGSYVQPTVWTGLKQDARCQQEEIFGPVCHVAPFDTEDEAVRLANDTQYGLAASVWTTDLDRAHRVARRLDAGLVWVNSWFLRDLRTPFGGVKLSGIGREGGRWSLDFYRQVSTVTIAVGRQ